MAAAPLSASSGCISQARSCSARINRLVRLSSTTSTRTPSRRWWGFRAGPELPAAARTRGRVNQKVAPSPCSRCRCRSGPPWPPLACGRWPARGRCPRSGGWWRRRPGRRARTAVPGRSGQCRCRYVREPSLRMKAHSSWSRSPAPALEVPGCLGLAVLVEDVEQLQRRHLLIGVAQDGPRLVVGEGGGAGGIEHPDAFVGSLDDLAVERLAAACRHHGASQGRPCDSELAWRRTATRGRARRNTSAISVSQCRDSDPKSNGGGCRFHLRSIG